MCILATYIYVVKEKVSLAAEGQFIPPPIEAGDFLSVRLNVVYYSLTPPKVFVNTSRELYKKSPVSFHSRGGAEAVGFEPTSP